MGGTPVALGPFQRGLNIAEDPRLIADNELAECINLNIGRAGELMVRPGLKAVRTAANGIAGTGHIRVINSVILPTGYSRLYVRRYDISPNVIYRSDNPGSTGPVWTAMGNTAAGQVGVVIQYVDVTNTTVPHAWFVPRGAGAVAFRQNLDTGAEESLSTSGFPRGSGAVIFKNRLFVYGPVTEGGAGTYRVYYSATGDFKTWPVNNFFDVGPGDGEFVTCLIVQQDSLIIFKRNSTWVLYFDSDPFQGTLRRINTEIGATGPHSVAQFQNEIYVVSRRSIFRMVNLLFDDIGRNLAIQQARTNVNFDQFNDTASIIGTRILFGVATGGGIVPFRYFVYHTEVQAWSQYDFNEYPERFIPVLDQQAIEHQFATRATSANLYDYKPFTTNDADWGDFPNDTSFVSMATKKYSFSSPANFKRIFWWAIEVVGNGKSINMYVVADDLRQGTSVSRAVGTVRSVLKAFTTNRFRTIQFYITSTTSGVRFTFLQGQANVSDKAKVFDAVTS